MASDYWSCSKFADWLRGTSKIKSGSSNEWNDWEKLAKQKKIRYWLAEDGIDYLQNFINWPKNLLNNTRFYIDNRWISKTHALNSSLKKGTWHEFETRFLYSSFDSLVDFVEIEQAWHHTICCDEAYKKYKSRSTFSLSKWRCPELGLEYLDWASHLCNDEEWNNKDDPDFGKPTKQALAAQETIVLYNWWKKIRPNRPIPMDASGLGAFYDEREIKAKEGGDSSFLGIFDENESQEDKTRSSKLHHICDKMEQDQYEEDTEMLIRLVKLRPNLWT